MADFLRALPFVFRHEGGWSNDPADPGGATKFGITLRTLRGLGRDLDGDGDVDADDVRMVTPQMAADIYRNGYWRFSGIFDQRVATKVFDMAVNMGLAASVRIIQDGLNGLGAGLTVDGAYGPVTESTINAVHPDRALDLLCLVAKDHYNAIVANRPKSKKFLRGWLARAAEVPAHV